MQSQHQKSSSEEFPSIQEFVSQQTVSHLKGTFKCGKCQRKYKSYSSFYTHCKDKHDRELPQNTTFNGRPIKFNINQKGRPQKQQSSSVENNDQQNHIVNQLKENLYLHYCLKQPVNVEKLNKFMINCLNFIYSQGKHPLPKNKKKCNKNQRKIKRMNQKLSELNEIQLLIQLEKMTLDRIQSSSDQNKLIFFKQFFFSLNQFRKLKQKSCLQELVDPKSLQEALPCIPLNHEKISQHFYGYDENSFYLDQSKIEHLMIISFQNKNLLLSQFQSYQIIPEKIQMRILWQLANLYWLANIVKPIIMVEIFYLNISTLYEQSLLEKPLEQIQSYLSLGSECVFSRKKSSSEARQRQSKFNQNIKTLLQQQGDLDIEGQFDKKCYCKIRYNFLAQIGLY